MQIPLCMLFLEPTSVFVGDTRTSVCVGDACASVFVGDARTSVFAGDARTSVFVGDARASVFVGDARTVTQRAFPLENVGVQKCPTYLKVSFYRSPISVPPHTLPPQKTSYLQASSCKLFFVLTAPRNSRVEALND